MSEVSGERAIEVLRVVDVEYIRKLHYVNGLSQREIARRLRLSRNTVAKYLQAVDVVPRYKRKRQMAHT